MPSRIWYMVYDARTASPLPIYSPAYLLRAGIEFVRDVKAAIHARDVRDYRFYSGVSSDQLQVFRDMDEYEDPEMKPLVTAESANGLGEDKDHALVVLVPPPGFDLEALRFDWTPSGPRVQLSLSADVRELELPQACTLGSGLDRSVEPWTLFCRPQVLELWKEIYRCCIRTYALLWIVGPSGTGKSCAALAFAYALRPSQWDVVWIHLSRQSKLVSCVWLRGNRKTTCTLQESQVFSLLSSVTTSSDKSTVVCLDGYDNRVAEWQVVCVVCIQWRRQDVNRHRLLVTSMSHGCSDFRHSAEEIPATVAMAKGEGLHDEEMAGSNSGEQGEGLRVDDVTFGLGEVNVNPKELVIVYDEMKLDLLSWSLEDYTSAIQCEAFFQRIKDVFPSYIESKDPSANAEMMTELLGMKYCVAGGSARLMFGFSTEDAVAFVDDAVERVQSVHDIIPLLALYPGSISGSPDTCLMSAYVVRKIAVSRGSAMLDKIARARTWSSVTKEWLFVGWFLSALSTRGVECVGEGFSKSQKELERADVIFFDLAKASLDMPLDRPVWITPVQWNEAGYDAVFVDRLNGLVQFVQATRADRHSYQHRYFVDMLHKLAVHDDLINVQFNKVQLYFVVPMKVLPDFHRPVSTTDFKKDVVGGCSFMFEKYAVDVRTLGVDYKVSPY